MALVSSRQSEGKAGQAPEAFTKPNCHSERSEGSLTALQRLLVPLRVVNGCHSERSEESPLCSVSDSSLRSE